MSSQEHTTIPETGQKPLTRLLAYIAVAAMVLIPVALVITIAGVLVHFIVKFW